MSSYSSSDPAVLAESKDRFPFPKSANLSHGAEKSEQPHMECSYEWACKQILVYIKKQF